MGLEKKIETEILNYLSKQKDVFAWKVNTTGVFDKELGVYRRANSPFILKGVSDILGVHSSGKILAIEVKASESAYRSKDQEAFVSKINRMGGFACFASTIAEVTQLLSKVRQSGSCGDKKD
jgi:hypothetical protein